MLSNNVPRPEIIPPGPPKQPYIYLHGPNPRTIASGLWLNVCALWSLITGPPVCIESACLSKMHSSCYMMASLLQHISIFNMAPLFCHTYYSQELRHNRGCLVYYNTEHETKAQRADQEKDDPAKSTMQLHIQMHNASAAKRRPAQVATQALKDHQGCLVHAFKYWCCMLIMSRTVLDFARLGERNLHVQFVLFQLNLHKPKFALSRTASARFTLNPWE
jgi:hypothetical protein